MTLTATGTAQVSAQQTDSVWLVLLTIDHADLEQPIRVTSDGRPTLSNGDLYQPFPFAVTLPDDVEGRAPQARLQIDNTSLEVVAQLRGLATPPSVRLQIVRAEDPDVIEREWVGLEWRSSAIDLASVTGTLSVEDLALEEFPYVTFDGRFKGLFP